MEEERVSTVSGSHIDMEEERVSTDGKPVTIWFVNSFG